MPYQAFSESPRFPDVFTRSALQEYCRCRVSDWSMSAMWLIPKIDPNGKQLAVYAAGYMRSLAHLCGHKLCLGLTGSDNDWSSINW